VRQFHPAPYELHFLYNTKEEIDVMVEAVKKSNTNVIPT
jgi:hypothetical protein